ncbi:Pheromone shutdown protein [Leptospira levettii]|uniref:TraB/GumN family protein n=1 Tax=Leptospira levettii TaxID=2023178 RepID=UPI000C29EEAB|nr:TraB/GumN family protein [Leptospira levettii]MCW7473206.1 TraB/GumN family protein [Leptospira levettii]PJZ36264.1 Pheromone shutdown protein [Leptospira levettii]PJZ89996.1 Pheromone shutdown protein [Leptospira levettii]PJZ99018.1 Pheromone shutdown protein [Leptospira levettii]
MRSIKKTTPPRKSTKKGFKTKEPYLFKNIDKTEVHILGTAHISKQSVEEVEKLIQSIKPDVICVELCESRMKSVEDPDYLKKLDIFKVFKERKMWLLLSSLILSSFQKKMGNQDIKPGDEMRKAITLGRSLKKPVLPVDREIQTTLKRSWGNVGFFSKMYLFSALLASLLVREDVSDEKIEEMKSDDILKDLFSQIPKKYESIKNVIIDERDVYLAEKIRVSTLDKKVKKVVAVVGAGHLAGIERNIDLQNDLSVLDEVPKRKLWDSLSLIIYPVFFAGLIGYTTWSQGGEAGLDLFSKLIYIKGGLAALGALIAWAHPISILLAFITAPIGTFVPIFKAGWVSALSESYLRKPLVEDFERIAEDSESFQGFWKNRVLHIFLVFFLPQFGSTIGTFIVAGKGLKNLF